MGEQRGNTATYSRYIVSSSSLFSCGEGAERLALQGLDARISIKSIAKGSVEQASRRNVIICGDK